MSGREATRYALAPFRRGWWRLGRNPHRRTRQGRRALAGYQHVSSTNSTTTFGLHVTLVLDDILSAEPKADKLRHWLDAIIASLSLQPARRFPRFDGPRTVPKAPTTPV